MLTLNGTLFAEPRGQFPFVFFFGFSPVNSIGKGLNLSYTTYLKVCNLLHTRFILWSVIKYSLFFPCLIGYSWGHLALISLYKYYSYDLYYYYADSWISFLCWKKSCWLIYLMKWWDEGIYWHPQSDDSFWYPNTASVIPLSQGASLTIAVPGLRFWKYITCFVTCDHCASFYDWLSFYSVSKH